MRKGLFIAFEGSDGAGKSSAIARMHNMLASLPFSSLTVTHEPTDGALGRHIYDILFGRAPMLPPLELQRLYVLDRHHHFHSLLGPSISTGGLVVADRYWIATLAHGMLSHPADTFLRMHDEIFDHQFTAPDLTFIFDISPDTALARMQEMGKTFDLWEKKEKLERIRANYHELARLIPSRGLGAVHMINADRAPATIDEEVLSAIQAVVANTSEATQ